MSSRFDPYSEDVLDAARQVGWIRQALIATRAKVDPASASATELDELIELAAAARDDLQDDARTVAIMNAALGRSTRDVADG